jgi:ATP-binding cassette, subfamily F, member 3
MLTVADITYRIEGRVLLQGASARVPAGRKVGLVGKNGTGKSTLFRLITREIEPETGEIAFPSAWKLGMIAQEAPDGPQSLIDTVLAADAERTALMDESETATDPQRISDIHMRLIDIDAWGAPARAAEILAGLGFDAEAQARPCQSFSGGWRMRVALASVLFTAPDLLLLDEPTNYLDIEGVIWLEEFLRDYPKTIVIISHDRDLLNRSVDSILHLEQQKLTYYTGGYDAFEETRRMKLELQAAARVKQETQRKHMQAFVDRFRAKASKARQAQSRMKALAKLKPIAAVAEDRTIPFNFPNPEPSNPPMMTLEKVSVGYGDKIILNHLNLRIDPDDRIALLGSNGNGKSTFAKLLAGRLAAKDGVFFKGRKIDVGYFAQHQLDEFDPKDTPVMALGRLMPDAPEQKVRTRLGGFGFSNEKSLTAIGKLSGGEKARLMMAIASLKAPQLLILDEPTNHLDIDSREALIHAINEYDGAVIVISHDRHIVETCVDTLWLVADGRVKPFDGDLDDYARLTITNRRKEASKPQVVLAAAEALPPPPPRDPVKLKKAADTAERRMADIADKIATLDRALAVPGLFEKDPPKAARFAKERGNLALELEKAESEWLDASAALELAGADA